MEVVSVAALNNSLRLPVCRRDSIYVVTVLTVGSVSVKRNLKLFVLFVYGFISRI
jgi:hypothetical protein